MFACQPLSSSLFPSLCKPSFKTDFLPLLWSKHSALCISRAEVEKYRCDLKKLQMWVLTLQPDFEISLKKPQSLVSWTWATFHSSSLAHDCVLAFDVDIPVQLDYAEKLCDPKVLKSVLLTPSGVEMTTSRRLRSSFITTVSPDISVQFIVGTCKYMMGVLMNLVPGNTPLFSFGIWKKIFYCNCWVPISFSYSVVNPWRKEPRPCFTHLCSFRT